MARATCLVIEASGTTPDGGVRFSDEFSIMAGAFTLGHVLNFGSLAYVAYCYDELRPLHGAAPVGTEPPASPTMLGLLGPDIKILAR